MWWLCLILSAAVGVRLACSLGDLWLDEIWSIRLADSVSTPLGVFTSIHHDNNHHLNTLVDFFLNHPHSLWHYRLGPVFAGSLAVLVAASCARHPRERRFTAILFAFSFLLVFYSSEARGYAYLMLFSLLAYLTFISDLRPIVRALVFTIVCILGFLSHLSFLFTYSGLLSAGVVSAWQNGNWRESRVWTAVPALLFLIWLWFVDLRMMSIGGDQPSDPLTIIFYTAELLTFPGFGWLAGIASLAVLAGAGIWDLWKSGNRREWAFFVVAILLCPAVVVMVRTQSYLSPRYFLIPAIFALLLAARALSRIPGRLATVIVIVFVSVNVWALARQMRLKRGAYSDAVALICAVDPAATVGSDHDFRNEMVIEFYAQKSGSCKGLHYERMEEWSSAVPRWLVLHSLERAQPAPQQIHPQSLGDYNLAGFFPSGEISGWNWAVYRRIGR